MKKGPLIDIKGRFHALMHLPRTPLWSKMLDELANIEQQDQEISKIEIEEEKGNLNPLNSKIS